jgi:hypothetical protein
VTEVDRGVIRGSIGPFLSRSAYPRQPRPCTVARLLVFRIRQPCALTQGDCGVELVVEEGALSCLTGMDESINPGYICFR